MFVITPSEGLVQLQPTEFDNEDLFQGLLEQHPELLSGDLMNTEQPRRWVLVSREMPVPGEVDGKGIWSADHLFLDQDGVPTIVEVKRQTDIRLRRREVVAQMLDYAANGTAYWKVDSLRSRFEEKCAKLNTLPEQELQAKLGIDVDSVEFWNRVKTNLEAGKIRLLFVADLIPRELRVVVEFLNRQMNPAEVLALELKHFAIRDGLRTLVPTLVGQTETTRGAKSGAVARDWNEASFFEKLSAKTTPEVVYAAREILAWIETRTTSKAIYGHGNKEGSITGYFKVNDLKLTPMQFYTTAKLYITFSECLKPPFDSENKGNNILD